MAATPAVQTLRVNASLGINKAPSYPLDINGSLNLDSIADGFYIGGNNALRLPVSATNLAIGTNAGGTSITSAVNGIFIGQDAGAAVTTASNCTLIGSFIASFGLNFHNCTYIGGSCGRFTTSAQNNIGIGYLCNRYNQSGGNNVIIGTQAGQGVSGNSHANNLFLGYQSAFVITTGSSNIFLGNLSGSTQTTLSNLLIIDNQARANPATELTNSILYGVMAATPDLQFLRVNATVSNTNQALTLANGATTFLIKSNVMTVTGDGGGNTIATITGANSGTLLTLIFVDGNITITDTDAHTADTVDLVGTATDFTSADDTVLQLVYDGTSWYETSRSVN